MQRFQTRVISNGFFVLWPNGAFSPSYRDSTERSGRNATEPFRNFQLRNASAPNRIKNASNDRSTDRSKLFLASTYINSFFVCYSESFQSSTICVLHLRGLEKKKCCDTMTVLILARFRTIRSHEKPRLLILRE
mmetsp:Transcript_21955/g.61010  ORF Transcript_21955/g.61010 Transcript_21955/m.61010 type:complete len:134 (-) Transcript_21955:104-505(-)